MMVFEEVSYRLFFSAISVISLINADILTKKAFFSAATPDEASITRIFLKGFSSPSELACSQKCLHHDQCNFKKYNPDTKHCELLQQINNDDLSKNAAVTKKNEKKHSLCKPLSWNGCGKNCKCEVAFGRYTCNCTKQGVFKSCKAALESNGFQTAIYQILPATFGKPIITECMKDEQGTSFAVLHHNNENPTTVKGYEEWGSYKLNFTYSSDLSVIISMINKSSHCQQFTRARCYHVYITGANWVQGRDGQKLDFWGGGPSEGAGCACGITSSCVGSSSRKCNCDKNDHVWRSDSGDVIKKEVLPITSIAVGDTGHSFEKFIYTIGPLLCVI